MHFKPTQFHSFPGYIVGSDTNVRLTTGTNR